MSIRSAAVFAGASVWGASVLLAGCSQVSGAVAGVFGGGGADVVDAHTVYRLRPGCTSLAARTLDHGFTILTPQDGGPFEISGLFEGPAREGESVFRYVPPGEGETWDTVQASDVFVEVHAVDVELPGVREWMDRLCGPLPPGEGEPGQNIPRVPAASAAPAPGR